MITGHSGKSALLEGDLSAAPASPGYKDRSVTLLTVYAFLLMFIPSTLVVAPLGSQGSPATIFAVALMGWYLMLWLHPWGALDRGRQPVRTAAVLFSCAVVASYVSASRQAMAVLVQNGADRGLIATAGWLAVLLLAADGIGRWDRLQVLLRRIVAAGTALAAIGVLQFVTGLDVARYVVIPGLANWSPLVDVSIRQGLNRPSVTATQPLEFAAVLAVCLPLALHQARYAAPGSRLRNWLQVALIAAAMPMTVSRSAVLGLAVTAVVLIPTWPARQRRAASLLIVGAVGLVWIAMPTMLTAFLQLFSQIGAESSSTSRLGAYSAAVPLIAGHPWLGRGFQTFFPQTYFFVDNQYLTALIETGFVGLLALLALLATGWFAARSARRAVTHAQTRDQLQCLAASVAAAAVSFATFDALSFTMAAGLTFLVLGCAGAAWRLVRAEWRAAGPEWRAAGPEWRAAGPE